MPAPLPQAILPGSIRFATVRNLAQAAGPVLFFGGLRGQTTMGNGPEGPWGQSDCSRRRVLAVWSLRHRKAHKDPAPVTFFAIHS